MLRGLLLATWTDFWQLRRSMLMPTSVNIGVAELRHLQKLDLLRTLEQTPSADPLWDTLVETAKNGGYHGCVAPQREDCNQRLKAYTSSCGGRSPQHRNLTGQGSF
jgi:hypothetical protein